MSSGDSHDRRGDIRAAGAARFVRRLTLPVLLLVVASASLWGAPPAGAISQRGHVLGFSFGGSGKEAGQFKSPAGIGVNNSTGDVYVADHKNKRVEEFEPVRNGEGVVTEEKFVRELPVTSPNAIAVDNSTEAGDPSKGDVYVVSGKVAILKFSPSGTLIATIKKFVEEGEKEKLEGVQGLAVDAHGNLLVYEEGTVNLIQDFDNSSPTNVASGFTLTGFGKPGRSGFAADAEGNFYTAVLTEDPATEAREHEEGREEFPVIGKASSSGSVLIPQLDSEVSNAVAVDDAAKAIYIDNLTLAGGAPHSSVAAFTPQGALIQRLTASGLTEAAGVGVDPADGTLFVSDAASSRVYVFVPEPAGPPSVEGLTQTVKPGASELSAKVDPRGAETKYFFEYGSGPCPSGCTKGPVQSLPAGFSDQPAQLELTGLAPGVYDYRAVAENEHGTAAAEGTFSVTALVSGLPDGRGWEMVSPSEKDGAEPEAITKEGGLIQAAADGHSISFVADGPMPAKDEPEGNRVPEYAQILADRAPSGGWSSQDIITPNEHGIGVLTGGAPEYQWFSPNLSLALVEPSAGNAKSGNLEHPPLSPPLVSGEAQEKTIYLRDNKPLSPGPTEAESFEAAVHNGETMGNPGFLALVTKQNFPGNFGGGQKEGLEFVGASPDLQHVVFDSFTASSGLYEWAGQKQPLKFVSVLPNSTHVSAKEASLGGSGGLATRHAVSNDGSHVFFSSGGHLYVRDTITEETLQADALQGGSGTGTARALFQTASASGGKVFFTDPQRLTSDSRAGANEDADLYVYETTGGTKVGEPIKGVLKDLTPEALDGGSGAVLSTGGGGGVIGASEDGSYVYFVANGALAPGAPRGTCSGPDAAQPAATVCSLFVRRFQGGSWTATKLVAVLSPQDRSDWGGTGIAGDPGYLTAQVSPNGEYLAFMSKRSLTGYDNEDVSSKSPGERLDEEVFLYHAGDERTVCASCNPSGARPRGIFDTGSNGGGGAGEGLGLVLDRLQIWGPTTHTDKWLAAALPGFTTLDRIRALYQSRYIDNQGRLFFNSADAIAPVAKPTKPLNVEGEELQVGVTNVYQYEPTGVGTCASGGGCVALISSGTSEHESVFLDASESGNDVFFLTAAPLSPLDIDTNFDIYDAHVCEAALPCPPPPPAPTPPCENEECQGAYQTPGAPAGSNTSTAGPSGNLAGKPLGGVLGTTQAKKPAATTKPKPLTRAQKLARALKSCRKLKQKKKRVACEKAARKKYGVHKAKHASTQGHSSTQAGSR